MKYYAYFYEINDGDQCHIFLQAKDYESADVEFKKRAKCGFNGIHIHHILESDTPIRLQFEN